MWRKKGVRYELVAKGVGVCVDRAFVEGNVGAVGGWKCGEYGKGEM